MVYKYVVFFINQHQHHHYSLLLNRNAVVIGEERIYLDKPENYKERERE